MKVINEYNIKGEEKMEKVRELLSQWKKDTPGGQIYIEKGDEVLVDENFGLASLEWEIPITEDTIFHIASVSKQFTVLAILLCWEDGLLDLEDDIRDYVPDLYTIPEKITIRQMMNNNSGIKDQWEMLGLRGIKINDVIGPKELKKTIRSLDALNFTPGEQYMYSNTGFYLLATIVERVSGEDFDQFVKNRIFEPLGMDSTEVRTSYSKIIKNYSSSYVNEGNGYYYNPLNYEVIGATSVNSRAKDLINMLREYKERSVFSNQVLTELLKPGILNSGRESFYCGGLIKENWEGYTLYHHGGVDAGYRAFVCWLVEEDIRVVFLSNTTTYITEVKVKELLRMVLDLPEEKKESLIGSFGKAQAGLYYTEIKKDPAVIEILEEDEVFKMTRKYTNTELIPKEDYYIVGNLEERLYFKENGDLIFEDASTKRIFKKYRRNLGELSLSGEYRISEAKIDIFFERRDEGLFLIHPLYEDTLVLEIGEEEGLFFFEKKSCEHIYKKDGRYFLKGERTRNTRLEKR